MKPDRDTYEAWLLDRMEGRLDPQQERWLEDFLRANPDLPVTLGDLPAIDGGTSVFTAKEELRKSYPPTGLPDAARLDDFLVARSEQELSAEQERQLARYLYEHPGAERQAALMALARVPADAEPFPTKETLTRHFPPHGMPDAYRITDFLIADLEGDLSPEQHAALKHFLGEHAELQRTERSVAATRTVPEPMAFPEKAGLYRQRGRVVALWPRLAAAASIALVCSAAWWLMQERPLHDPGLARVETPVKPVLPPASGATAETAPEPRTPVATEVGAAAEKTIPAPRPSAIAKPGHDRGPETSPRRSGEAPLPTPAPKAEPVPAPVPVHALPLEEPALAEALPPAEARPVQADGPVGRTAPGEPAVAAVQGSDNSLGTFVANTLRNDVLDKPERPTGLDAGDVLALADKALGAVTGGEGGVTVQRHGGSERMQLRLGRNLSISAARNR